MIKMRRDWKLLAEIIQHLEEESLWGWLDSIESSDLAQHALILRHMELLQDAGYIKNFVLKTSVDGYLSYASTDVRITMQGYDFKDVILDKRVFAKVCETAQKAGVKVTWEFIKASIPLILKNMLKEM